MKIHLIITEESCCKRDLCKHLKRSIFIRNGIAQNIELSPKSSVHYNHRLVFEILPYGKALVFSGPNHTSHWNGATHGTQWHQLYLLPPPYSKQWILQTAYQSFCILYKYSGNLIIQGKVIGAVEVWLDHMLRLLNYQINLVIIYSIFTKYFILAK